MTPAVRFAHAHGARIAFQEFGEGEQTIVAVPPLAQNIEIAWDFPEIRAMLERFGSFSRYIHYDKRGTGASDRSCVVPGLDERVADLRAVFDAAEVEHAYLYIQSGGGPTAIAFAATFPARVDGLILHGSGAALFPAGSSLEERLLPSERLDDFVTKWGTDESWAVELFAPSRVNDDDFRRRHQRYERFAAGTDSLRDLFELNAEVDARELLPHVKAPALILHAIGDRAVPIEFGYELRDGLPDATMIEIDSADHLAYLIDPDIMMPPIEQFVTGTITHRPTRRIARRRISVLGGFEVTIDGREIPTSEWGGKTARQLCKRLVLALGQPVTRDELFDMFWPDEFDRSKLGARLSVQLSNMRRVLDGGVHATREVVALDLDEVECDLIDLMDAPDDGTADSDIIGLYRGELLPSDRYDDWTMAARDQARLKFVRAANRHVQQLDGTAAVSLAHGLVVADPYDPAHHDLLIEKLRAVGDSTGVEQARERRRKAFDG